MLRRTFALAILLYSMPALSHAWTLNTWVKSGGGFMQSPNLAGNQTSSNGSITKAYTTSSPLTVTITPNTGYSIFNLTLNGIIQTLSDPTAPYTTMVLGPPNQSVQTSFQLTNYTLSATAGAGGTVSPAAISLVHYGGQTPAQVFTFTPSSGFRVQSITIPGLVLNSDYQLANAMTNAAVTLPAAVNEVVKVSIFNVLGSATISGTFAIIGANAGPDQTVLPGAPVMLDGSATTGATTYSWTQVSGTAAVTLSGANTSQATFTAPATLGTYVFKLTINGGSFATTTVSVVNNIVQTARSQCADCHSTQGVGAGVYANWSSSVHKTVPVMCYTCHVGTNTGGHPGTLKGGTVNEQTFNYTSGGTNFCSTCHSPSIVTDFAGSVHVTRAGSASCSFCHAGGVHNPNAACVNCHTPGNPYGLPWPPGGLDFHNDYTGTNLCIDCHNLHNPADVRQMSVAAHFNNITSAGYPASYMTSRSVCGNCHISGVQNATIRHQWAKSGHAATTDAPWTESDFKTRSGCVQCHTTTGFIAYSTGKVTAAWGTASDKTKEVLTCIGCHSDVANGIVRTVSPVRPFADDAYRNRDIGASNICMNCHSGRNNGLSITGKVGTADFSDMNFVAPHFMAAGGILHGKGGYNFPGQPYAFYTSNTHRAIGVANNNGTGTAGPCIACHMSASQKHLFRAISTSSNGIISSITAGVCVNCHGGSLGAAQLSADKAAVTNALDVLSIMLSEKGFVHTANEPFFPNTDWGAGQAGADTMGAAFNYILLLKERGAYAHNSAYTKKMIFDSIEYLNNGTITGSFDAAAVQALADSGTITQDQASSLIDYKNSSPCTGCHGGPANTSAPMATNAHPAHLTSAYGPASYLGNDLSACQACHPYPAGHVSGTVDVLNGAASACAGCHPGTIPAWNGGVRLACSSCHGTQPSVISNDIVAPVKANFATTGHGQFAVSSQCTFCHNADSPHISVTINGASSRLNAALTGSLNAECNYCHNDAAKVSVQFRNMSTHFTAKGGNQAMACSSCHDPHGTNNFSMIRTSINGQTITFTDRETGLIDTTTNQGLCQVCHTLTAHYRAGVAESSHPTSDCLSCHPHNGAGGAFKPNGRCDACHGYPPAPRLATSSITFGTMNNWSSARFEDYSGGGGAHLVAKHVSPTANPAEGWANCAICHNGGRTDSAPYHRMTLPLSDHRDNVHIEVDPGYRFDNSFTNYTGAKLTNPPSRNITGSCFNVSCHMSLSPRWSIER